MQKHHEPKPSLIVKHFHFNKCNRQDGESISTYIAKLWQLAEHCEYGNSLNDMFHDRFVCGVEDSRIQWWLLAEPEHTFEKAFELAVAAESADNDTKDLQSSSQSKLTTAINQVNTCSVCTPKQCYYCRDMHKAHYCWFKTAECQKCHKKGHIAHACKSKPSAKSNICPYKRINT